MSEQIVLKWYWRYFVLGVEEFDSLDSAVYSAWYHETAGEESRGWFEVATSGGVRVVDGAEVRAITDRLEAAEGASYTSAPRVVATIHIRGVGEESTRTAVLDTYANMDEAQRDAERLRRFLGDRVTVEAR